MRWSDGLISKAEYKNICAEKQQEIQRLRGEIEKLNGLVFSGPKADSKDSIQSLNIEELTRETLDALVQAVRVFDDGRIEINWKI